MSRPFVGLPIKMERQPEDKQFSIEVDRGAEPEEDEEEQKRPWGRIILIILLLILLLVFFWPVKKGKKAPPKPPASKPTGIGIIGETQYRIISSKPHFELSSGKWTIVAVTFNIKNLASRARILDYSVVKLGDAFGNETSVNTFYTERYYETKKKKSPWGKRIAANKRKSVQAYFLIYKSPPKQYYLAGKDMDFKNNEFLKLDLGTIDIIEPR